MAYCSKNSLPVKVVNLPHFPDKTLAIKSRQQAEPLRQKEAFKFCFSSVNRIASCMIFKCEQRVPVAFCCRFDYGMGKHYVTVIS